MFNGIREYFNSRAKQRQEEKLFETKKNAIKDALNKNDGQAVATLFNDIKGSSLLTKKVYDDLLRSAINTDDVAIFSTLFNTQNKPTYWFTHYQDIHTQSSENILYTAIAAGSKAVALFLAKNEEVSIDKSGESVETAYALNGALVKREVTPYPAPLDFAEQKGMYDVAAVLAERNSKEYASKSRGYDARAQEARAKSTPPPKGP